MLECMFESHEIQSIFVLLATVEALLTDSYRLLYFYMTSKSRDV